mgnify:CR=1 FL=1
MSTAALAVALVANGILAGLFFAFACAVVPGFRRVDDRTFVLAFRAINRAILNGWFLLVFFAAPVSAVAAAVLGGWSWELIAAAALAVLTFPVTVAANVPRNNALDAADATTAAGMRAERERFEGPWARWNLVRTVAAVGALVALAVAGG